MTISITLYLVMLETLEIECIGNASALTKELNSIYFSQGEAMERGRELADVCKRKVDLGIGTECGGKFHEYLVRVLECEKSRDDEKLKMIKEVRRWEAKDHKN